MASWLTFDNLRLTTAGSSYGVFGGSSAAGSTHITLSNSVVTNTAGVGIIAPTASNSFWTIRNTTISHIGDSGLILFGPSHVITRDTITDTGWNGGIGWGKHGIYSKGADQTISYNDISRDQDGQAISIRFHGARVFGNSVHDTAAAIAGDDVAVARVVFRVDGNVVCIAAAAPYSCPVSVSSGTHSVSAEAVDTSDNRAVDYTRVKFR